MSCSECMYISGHSEHCVSGMRTQSENLTDEIQSLRELVHQLVMRLRAAEERITELEESRQRDAYEEVMKGYPG